MLQLFFDIMSSHVLNSIAVKILTQIYKDLEKLMYLPKRNAHT